METKALIAFYSLASLFVLYITLPIAWSVVIGFPYAGKVFSDREALSSIWLSLYAGFTASAVMVLFGTPLAYIFSRWRGKPVKVLESILEVPLALPHSVAGIMVLLAYNSRTSIGQLLSEVGLVIEDSFWGIVFAMAFVSAPIFISTVRAGFDSIDVEVENVARTLGSSWLQAFLRITLPLNLRHILAGAILSFARSISEVGAVLIVAYYPKVAATLVVERFLSYGLSSALSLTVVLIFISVAIFAALKIILRG